MPTSRSRADWMALAVGAAEPGDAAAMLRAAGPSAGLRLATLRTLAGLGAEPLPTWAPALPQVRSWVGRAPLLGEHLDHHEITPSFQRVRVGERVRLYVAVAGSVDGLRPLLLRQAPSGTTRLLPTAGLPWPSLDSFMLDDGVRVIDLVAGPPLGLQTLVLGLLAASEAEEPWPAGDRRDELVIRAVQSGLLPGASLTIEVV